jgi:spore coat protein U-like protein
VNRISKVLVLSAALTVMGAPRTVLSQCTVRATPVSFGNYDVFAKTPLDGTGTISVACSAGVVKAAVTLGPSSTSGTYNPRRMKTSTEKDSLDYNIFVDVARTTILGNGSGGTTDIRLKRPTGPPRPWNENISIYGRVPPGQDVFTGSYTDNLMVEIDW